MSTGTHNPAQLILSIGAAFQALNKLSYENPPHSGYTVTPEQVNAADDLGQMADVLRRHCAIVRRCGTGPWEEVATALREAAELCVNLGRFEAELRILESAGQPNARLRPHDPA